MGTHFRVQCFLNSPSCLKWKRKFLVTEKCHSAPEKADFLLLSHQRHFLHTIAVRGARLFLRIVSVSLLAQKIADRFLAVRHAKLRIDMRQVILHGLTADMQMGGDLFVTHPLSGERKNLEFLAAQFP